MRTRRALIQRPGCAIMSSMLMELIETTRAGIYAGWIGFGNLGDEAMYGICRERFPSVSWSTGYQLSYRPDGAQWLRRGATNARQLVRELATELRHQPRLRKLAAQGTHGLVKLRGGEVGLLGGGTLINRAPWNLATYRDLRKRTRSLVPIFGSGVASPEFWSSHPEWKDTRKEWVSALAELPIAGVRGPNSLALLREAGAENVVVSGDPAIAFHARYRNPPAWVRPDRPLRVGINTGDCSGNLWGQPDNLQNALVALAQWLQQQKHHVELLPVWSKDLDPCEQVARMAGLPASTVSAPLTTHDKFLRKVESFDLLIAVKLHAAVLASAANVPCIVLEYQPKCLDFAASIGWERFTIRTSQLTPGQLIDKAALLVEQLAPARQELSRNVGRLERQFDEYCRRIEPMILGKGAADSQASPSRTAAGWRA
jgi:hypothetical protein